MNEFESLNGKPGEYTLEDLEASAETGQSLTPDLDSYIRELTDQSAIAAKDDGSPIGFCTREEAEKAIQKAIEDNLRAMPAGQPVVRRSILDILAGATCDLERMAANTDNTMLEHLVMPASSLLH